jgi:hypothetical protein
MADRWKSIVNHEAVRAADAKHIERMVQSIVLEAEKALQAE